MNKSICFLVHSGSAAGTLALVANEIGDEYDIVVLETSRLNFIKVTPVTWTGPGLVRTVTSTEVGLLNPQPNNRIFLRVVRALSRFKPLRLIHEIRIRALLTRLNSRLIITCNDSTHFQELILKVAQSMGMSSVLMQEGPFVTIKNINKTKEHSSRIRHQLVLAVSDSYAAKYVETGQIPSRVKVVGVPRFDNLPMPRLGPRIISPKRLIYVFQPFVAQMKVRSAIATESLREMAMAINHAYNNQAFEFVIRTHPKADEATLNFFVNMLSVPYSMDSGEQSLPRSVLQFDTAIGHYSIGLMESLLVGVPAICWALPEAAFIDYGEFLKQQWLRRHGVPSASNIETFAHLISYSLQTGVVFQHQYDISEQVGPITKKSVHLSVQAIKELL